MARWARLDVAFGWALLLVTTAFVVGYTAAIISVVLP